MCPAGITGTGDPPGQTTKSVFCVATARPGGSSLLGHQASLRRQPHQTPPNPTKPRRTKPNHKKIHYAQFLFVLPFFGRPTPNRQTTPNQQAVLFQQQHELVGTTNIFLPFFGRQTEPNRTKPNQHMLCPPKLRPKSGARCAPGAAPCRTKKPFFWFKPGGHETCTAHRGAVHGMWCMHMHLSVVQLSCRHSAHDQRRGLGPGCTELEQFEHAASGFLGGTGRPKE